MLYLPSLILCGGLAWAWVLGSGRLIYPQAAALHAVFALLAFLVARAFLRHSRGAFASGWRRVVWNVAWLLALAFFNLAAGGNFLSHRHWGDPLSLRSMIHLLSQNSVQEQARTRLSLTGAAVLLLALGLFWLGAVAFRRLGASGSGRALAALLKRRPGLQLGAALSLGVALFASAPSLAREEPLIAFAGASGNLSDLPPLEGRRAAARLRDREALYSYDPGVVRPKKNVIVILSDSLRADHLPDWGYSRPTTPFLSGLFADPRTQRAEWAFSSCSESFCGITSVLSGQPYQDISHGSAKIYDYLAKAGYRSELILSGPHADFSGLMEFYGDDVDREHGPEIDRLLAAGDDSAILGYLDQLEPFDGRPKFFFFFLMSSHITGRRLPEMRRYLPDECNLALARWNSDDAAEVLRWAREPQRCLERSVNNYDNGVLQADHFIGRIFQGLEQKGYLEDALFLVSSDHADSIGEHNHIGHSYRLYNVDIRIPLYLWDSDPRPRPKELPIAAHPSYASTLLDRLGLPLPPTLAAPSLDRKEENFQSVHLTRRALEPCAAAIDGDRRRLFKLIACARRGELREELYEIVSDPAENHDLLADPATTSEAGRRAAELRGRLDFFYRNLLGRG